MYYDCLSEYLYSLASPHSHMHHRFGGLIEIKVYQDKTVQKCYTFSITIAIVCMMKTKSGNVVQWSTHWTFSSEVRGSNPCPGSGNLRGAFKRLPMN